MDKRFLSILVALVLVIIGVFIFTKSSSDKSNNGDNNQAAATNHVMGQGKSGITLMEYGDYQCPICGAYYLPLKQAVSQLSEDIYFQFRNLPLVSIHPNAFAAARAAEAAGYQNRYWEMHDKLYENQSDWSVATSPQSIFNRYAQELSLNLEQFIKDAASSRANNSINADLAEFDKTGRDMATPTFFLNGVAVENQTFSDPSTGLPSVERIVAFLQAEIDKKKSTN